MCSWHQLSDFYNCEKGDNYSLIAGTDGTLALLPPVTSSQAKEFTTSEQNSPTPLPALDTNNELDEELRIFIYQRKCGSSSYSQLLTKLLSSTACFGQQWSTWWPGSCFPTRSDPWGLFLRQDRPGTSSGPDVCRCFRRKNIWSISVLLLDEAGRRLHLFFAWWGNPGWKLGCKNSCANVREDIFIIYLVNSIFLFSMQGKTCLEWDSSSERATWLLNVFENLQSISNSCGLFCKAKACMDVIVIDAARTYFKIENLLLAWGMYILMRVVGGKGCM